MTRWVSQKWAVLIALALTICALAGCAKKEPEPEPGPETNASGFRVGYASEGVTAVEDEEAMSKAIDEAYQKAEEGRIALEYKNSAFSDDGVNFACYIANSVDNRYDMFIAIYGDLEFHDELYLSQLLRPGTAFERVALSRKLDPGAHTVYVAFTTVETTEDEQIIHGQSIVSMEFNVES